MKKRAAKGEVGSAKYQTLKETFSFKMEEGFKIGEEGEAEL